MAIKKLVTNSFEDDSVTAAKIENPVVGGIIPVGGIIIWSGATTDVGTGDLVNWRLCTGENNTPDLRDRFVVGAGGVYAVGAFGGSADAVVVEHTHTITDNGHSHSEAYNTASPGQDQAGSGSGDNDDTSTQQTSTETTGIEIDSEGVSGINANLPPYWALAYIMRVS
jgi:hypothetical protein